MNYCKFSICRRYRYTLEHVMLPDVPAQRAIMWIGLNPSTADEQQLDPTLRRIRDFSLRWGFTRFVMTNLFAFRATDPREMLKQANPEGLSNKSYLIQTALECDTIVAFGGTHGSHLSAGREIAPMLRNLQCLGHNKDGSPKHPLYVRADTKLVPLKK